MRVNDRSLAQLICLLTYISNYRTHDRDRFVAKAIADTVIPFQPNIKAEVAVLHLTCIGRVGKMPTATCYKFGNPPKAVVPPQSALERNPPATFNSP
ncbi:hypothetical protein I8752_15880 [Nostocaceae cyanobacterium CENA369]|uniref:Uncharacterized protein n=1 Tax=Dendronalium phyllosphericum CENA369 TaxID=1725256 RepID=A0A8J7I7G7_9NOST|nr:hypothetical protein [Dendronalium phyllosphericum]MBH8574475.1 hypothetical protein [Dendronalium phyllosphericum CENA369]